jgi:DNA-binding CsgD family transcriptional regulator
VEHELAGFEDWLDHPMVKRAQRKAGEAGTALDVLEELHQTMLALEERAPGVPFHELFEACRTARTDNRVKDLDFEGNEHLGLGTLEARQAVGAACLAQGMEQYEVDYIFGSRRAWGPGHGHNDRQAEMARNHPAIALHREGLTQAEIAERLGVGRSRVSQVLTRARRRGEL